VGRSRRRRDRLPHRCVAARTRALSRLHRIRLPRSGPPLRLCGWADEAHIALLEAGDLEAAAAIAQPWQEAVAGALGPIFSYLILIICVLAVRRSGPGLFSLVLGIGLVTPLRWLPAIPLLAVRLAGVQWTVRMDEAKLAERTGIPENLLLVLGVAALVLGYWLFVTAFPRGERARAIIPTLVGALAVGGPVWVLWLGPLVLP